MTPTKLVLRIALGGGAVALMICLDTIRPFYIHFPEGGWRDSTWGIGESWCNYPTWYALLVVILLTFVGAVAGVVGAMRRWLRRTWLITLDGTAAVVALAAVGFAAGGLSDAADNYPYGDGVPSETGILGPELAVVLVAAGLVAVAALLNALIVDRSVDTRPTAPKVLRPSSDARNDGLTEKPRAFAPVPQPVEGVTTAQKTHPHAVLAFLLGFFGSAPCFFFLAPFGWWLGAQTVRVIDANPAEWNGRGWAMAGKVLGIIGVVAAVVFGLSIAGLVVIAAVAA